jgi:hypothetical protein
MSTHATWVAWAAWLVWALLAGLVLLETQTTEGSAEAWVAILIMGPFTTVGAIVVSRQPHNTIGWLCCTIGLLGILGAVFAGEYARYALGPRVSLPGGVTMAWLNSWSSSLWAGVTLTFLPLLFPTGRSPSVRWRPVAWACGIVLAATSIVAAVMPGPLKAPGQPRNPVGIEAAGAILKRIDALLLLGFVLLVLLCAWSVVARFRRASSVERQQLKWFSFGVGQLALVLAAALVAPGLWDRWVPLTVSDLLFGISFAMIPVTIGIAILRYRLYDIDRLIHRTLVYGLLTTLLAAVYAGLVLSLGQLFGGIGTEPPSWAVAGATLAVAGLFQPARRRIQRAVDRRFNRRKYDAAKTIEAFGARLQNQVDLDTLSAELLDVVDQTMEPTQVSLWLQSSAEASAHS